MTAQDAAAAELKRGFWRCQFCGKATPSKQWKKDVCPNCGRKYDYLLAQDSEES